MTDTTGAQDVGDPAARRALLHEVLRLQDQHATLGVEWRAAWAGGDIARADDLNKQLLALTRRVEELTAGGGLDEEPPVAREPA